MMKRTVLLLGTEVSSNLPLMKHLWSQQASEQELA